MCCEEGPISHCTPEEFQQDGTLSHISKLAKQQLADHGISMFPHPPSLPDLNHIEPVWHQLKKSIQVLL